MSVKPILCREAKQKCYVAMAECGLEIRYLPLSFTTTYMALGVRFGSLDTLFEDEMGQCDIPAGTAHFLEHKVFDMPDGGDAFELFADLGASANAFTTNEYTAYTCSCTEHVEEVLSRLLKFVFTPSFDSKNVRKELGIIEQEILGCDDEPTYRVYRKLLQNMYPVHPIRNDIAGSIDTIKQVTPELLSRVYAHFYRPENMVLTIGGQMDFNAICRIVNTMCNKTTAMRVERQIPLVDNAFTPFDTTIQMDVACPNVAIGYKNISAYDFSISEGYYLDIGAACLFGVVSPLYRELLEGGHITRDFDAFYEWTFHAGHMILSYSAENTTYINKCITTYIADIETHMPSEELFEEIRRVIYADAILVFDNTTDAVLSDLEERMCSSKNYFYIPKCILSLCYKDFCKCLKKFFQGNEPYIVIANK